MRKVFVTASLFFLLAFSLPSFEKTQEFFQIYPVAKIPWARKLPLKTELYEVGPEAKVTRDFEFIFSVKSRHGNYEVRGLKKLSVLLAEIPLVETLKKKESGEETSEGIRQSIRETGQGFKLLVREPIGSAKNVGKAAAGFFRKSGKFLTGKTQKGIKSTSFKDKILEGAKREVANEVGVDVYSDNPYLQGEITRIAAGRSGGKAAVAIGKFLLPVGYLGAIAMTASDVSGSADKVVNTTDPWDLYDMNRKALKAMGLDDPIVDQFLLKNPYYNPREQTRIRYYFEVLKNFEGWKKIFGKCSSVSTQEESDQFLTSLEMLISTVEKQKDFQRVDLEANILYALKTDGETFVFLPYDFLFLSKEGKELAQKIIALREKPSVRKMTVFNFGLVSSPVKGFLSSGDVSVKEGLFFKEKGSA